MKPTLSIGIPAYNEEANIRLLLNAIIAQKQNNYILGEIIVISDGSTDKTALAAKSIQNYLIKVIDHKTNKGMTYRQNEFFKSAKGDIFVLLDADILPKDEYFLENLTAPIIIDRNVGMTSCKRIPLKSKTFIEKIINYGALMQNQIIIDSSVNNMYMCKGTSRAFSKRFADKLKWPEIPFAEDIYAYLFCKDIGFNFIDVDETYVFYRTPQNLKDHLRQSLRFKQSQEVMYNYFPKAFVDKNYKIPKSILFKNTFIYFIKNPIFFILYIFIYIISVFVSLTTNKTIKWTPAQSSKVLVK